MNIFRKPLRWGFIGCGSVTEQKSGPAYQQVEGFELRAVMRRDIHKARDYAMRHGVPLVFESADALIHSPEIDAVYIATPPDSHKAYALQVAAAGKPCCIEKPMAPTYADCAAITTAFDQLHLPVFVAYYRRSLPRFQQVHQWLQVQAIGSIRHIHWHLNKPASPWDLNGEDNWRTDACIAPGGYFDDLASHGLDLFCYLLGPVTQASGICTNQQQLYSSYDAVSGCWLHSNNVTGSGSWNFGCAQREDRVEIFGSTGKIVFSVFAEAPLELHNAQGVQTLHIDNPDPIQLHHVANLRDALWSGKPHPSTGRSAMHTAWVMEEILRNTD